MDDRNVPPVFLKGMTEYCDERVIGFRPMTEVIPGSAEPGHGSNVWYRTEVVGYQLVTEHGLYEFTTDGVNVRATMLLPT